MLRFGAKVPGLGLDVRSVTMDFTYGSAFSVDSPDAYETLILDALQGDASLFTRADEVEEAWGIVDPIIDALGRRAAARLPELRRRHVGTRRGRRAARPRRPALAPVLGATPMTDRGDDRTRPIGRAGPALVGARPQHRRDRDASWPGSGRRRTSTRRGRRRAPAATSRPGRA